MTYSLLIAVVLHDKGEIITGAAVSAGSFGGTVLMGRGLSSSRFAAVLGIESSKDVVYETYNNAHQGPCHTDDAMAAARKAGASGGTAINARGTAREDDEKFFGMHIVPEKELLLIVVDQNNKQAVLDAIRTLDCLSEPGSGIAYSAPVSDFTLLASANIEHPGVFEIRGELFGPEDNYSVGLPKDSDGVAFINEFLRTIEADGTWAAMDEPVFENYDLMIEITDILAAAWENGEPDQATKEAMIEKLTAEHPEVAEMIRQIVESYRSSYD